ncbi:hypothetical protein [Nitratireductor sp. XY-223]|uniref:hypothetical protein n=1 Tax=Nitratireductor sp. XY-223 TaxID=2561926 RepID=UPI0010AAFF20|nr:hypothetical protein [Nitratireductor sp. XY-223]
MSSIWRMPICLMIAVALCLVFSVSGSAQELKFGNFRCLLSGDEVRTTTIRGIENQKVCQIGDEVTVDVVGGDLVSWEAENSREHIAEKLILSLDGHLLFGNYARVSPDGKRLKFNLERDPAKQENFASWLSVLPRTRLYDSQKKEMAVVLETSGREYGSGEIGIRAASIVHTTVAAILFAGVFLLFVILTAKTDLLRDPGPLPDLGKRPYSLGKTQMAAWFFPIFAAFLYLWLVTDRIDLLTPGVLGLIGISSATGVFAAAITVSKQTSEAANRSELIKQRQLLQEEISKLNQMLASDDVKNDPAKSARL